MQAASFSPPGAPEAPAAPMTSSPTLIGSAPSPATTFGSVTSDSYGLSFSRLTRSPDGERKVRAV